MSIKRCHIPGAIALLLTFPVMAATAPVAAVAPPSPLSSLLQVIFGLGVVLAAIVGAAWLFRRMSGGMLGVTNRLKVISGVLVGQRERVVIVEVEGRWLVLGVTSHSVNLLSTLDRPPDADAERVVAQEPFARRLMEALEKSRQKTDSSRK